MKGPAKITQKFFHDSHFSIFIAPRQDDEEEEEEEEPAEIHSEEEQAIEEAEILLYELENDLTENEIDIKEEH